MARLLLQRVLYTLPVIWLVVSLVFLLIHLVPGDPIQQMLGEGAPPADIAATRHVYGLDAPLGEQYIRYWKGVLHGDLGPSFRYNQSVTRIVAQRYPYTLRLTLASLFVAIILSIPAGVRSARHRNLWDDRLLSVVSLFGLSFPNFALGPILILFFAIKLGWLPVSGAGSFANLVLPAVTMGGALAAILTRMVRTSMLEELSQDYIRTARAKGLPERTVVYRHALRNAMIPIITVLGLQFGDRNNLLLARHRPPDHSSHLESRLLSGARLHPGDWVDVCRGEFPDGCAVLGREPEDQAVRAVRKVVNAPHKLA